jgi:hypothetical protein
MLSFLKRLFSKSPPPESPEHVRISVPSVPPQRNVTFDDIPKVHRNINIDEIVPQGGKLVGRYSGKVYGSYNL